MNERVTLKECASQCRELCSRDASANDGRKCGEGRDLPERGVAYSFCGYHWGPVMDADE